MDYYNDANACLHADSDEAIKFNSLKGSEMILLYFTFSPVVEERHKLHI